MNNLLIRLMMLLFYIVFIFLVVLFGLIKYLEATSVFYPGKVLNNTPIQAGMKYEDLYITTKDGVKINAWLVKVSSKAPTLIFAHGNAGTMSERIMKVKFWHELGVNVLVFDYRGFGESEGSPTEQGVYLDAQAVYDYLQARDDIDHKKIIAYGASLGGAVMIDLATHRRVAALIVESSFTSAPDMAKRIYPMLPTFFMSIKFDSMSKVQTIPVPKLFMHSHDDHTIPFSIGQKLFDSAIDPKEFLVIMGGHNEGSFISDPAIRTSIKKFLAQYSL